MKGIKRKNWYSDARNDWLTDVCFSIEVNGISAFCDQWVLPFWNPKEGRGCSVHFLFYCHWENYILFLQHTTTGPQTQKCKHKHELGKIWNQFKCWMTEICSSARFSFVKRKKKKKSNNFIIHCTKKSPRKSSWIILNINMKLDHLNFPEHDLLV